MLGVGIAADHGGFDLKEQLAEDLRRGDYEVLDFGAYELLPGDDYPDYIIPLVQAVAKGEVARGIAICGSGVGACVAANKVPGVRAGLIHDVYSARQGVELYLPIDFLLGASMDSRTVAGTCRPADIPDDLMVLDVGPKSVTLFGEVLKLAKTVMWNCPMGVFENPAFADGFLSPARIVASLDDALTIVGGGDTDAVIHMLAIYCPHLRKREEMW
jgi:hypothetical protein